MIELWKLLVVMVVLQVIGPVLITEGYPSGPPNSACQSMTPNHGDFTAMPNDGLFNITMSHTEYTPGQEITVVLESVTGFKGFFVQARTSDETRVGRFVVSDTSTQRPRCDVKAVSHVNRQNKTSVTLTWLAPEQPVGDVRFRVTVVETFSSIFTDVTEYLMLPTTTMPTTTPSLRTIKRQCKRRCSRKKFPTKCVKRCVTNNRA